MKTLLTRLALTATTVAVSAGTLTVTSGAAHAVGLEVPENLTKIVLNQCANPAWVSGEFQSNVPTEMYAISAHTIGEADGTVAHWAHVIASPELDGQVPCLVFQVEEPAAIKDGADSRAQVALQTIGGFSDIKLATLNPDYAEGEQQDKYGYVDDDDPSALLGGDDGVSFRDHDADPNTPRVAEFGAHLTGSLPSSGISVSFIVKGTQATTTTVTTDKVVSVERTAAEKANALAIKQTADRAAHAKHTKASKGVSTAKSAERKKVVKSRSLSAKAKRSRLKAIDAKYRTQQRALSATCVSARKVFKADYLRAIAPYAKTVTESVDKTVKSPFTEQTDDTIPGAD